LEELDLILSKDNSISELPGSFVKIILDEDGETMINPLKHEYIISNTLHIKLNGYSLLISPQDGVVSIKKGKDNVKVYLNECLVHVKIGRRGDIVSYPYPDLETFMAKMGISGHHPKY
jgi:hypothetical protein